MELAAESLPIEGYDKMTVKELTPLLETLDAPGLLMVREYEVAHAKRVTLLRAIEERMTELEAK